MEDKHAMDQIEGLSDASVDILKSNYESVLPDKMQKLHQALIESLDLSEFNIQERSMAASRIALTWVTKHHTEQHVLKKLENKLDTLQDAYVEQYGGDHVPKYVTIAAAEKDVSIKKLKDAIDIQADVVRYLAETVKIIKENPWSIKNAISIMQMERV